MDRLRLRDGSGRVAVFECKVERQLLRNLRYSLYTFSGRVANTEEGYHPPRGLRARLCQTQKRGREEFARWNVTVGTLVEADVTVASR